MTTPSSTRAYVLHSGGIDSTTCLAIAIQKHGKSNVTAIGIDYGQRHIQELRAAQTICRQYEVRQEFLGIGEQPRSMLVDPSQKMVEASYEDLAHGHDGEAESKDVISPTYVHFRNGQMMSKVAAFASAELEDNENAIIYVGMHAEDSEDAYPDCRLDFVGAMASAIYIGTYNKVRISAPLIELTKDRVIRWGTDLAAPLGITWSCYTEKPRHCGVCPTCRARKQAFFLAGIFDPTSYETYS